MAPRRIIFLEIPFQSYKGALCRLQGFKTIRQMTWLQQSRSWTEDLLQAPTRALKWHRCQMEDYCNRCLQCCNVQHWNIMSDRCDIPILSKGLIKKHDLSIKETPHSQVGTWQPAVLLNVSVKRHAGSVRSRNADSFMMQRCLDHKMNVKNIS